MILTYNANEAGARDTVAAIEQEGGTAVGLPLEAGRSDTFRAFHESVVAVLRDTFDQDELSFLINNAGWTDVMFADTTEELFDKFSRVLLKGPYFLTQNLLPLLGDGERSSMRPATPRWGAASSPAAARTRR